MEMLFSQEETLEDRIIRYLVVEEQTAQSLLKRLLGESDNYSIQAVYLVLKRLTTAEIVIKRGTHYFLNEEWRLAASLQLQQRSTTELSEKESATYILSSLVHYDLQWKNIVLPLHVAHPKDPVFFYSHHYIWLYLGESRKQSELAYFSSFSKNKNHAFSLIGSKSTYDIEVKKRLQNEFVQWAVGTEHFSKKEYVTVFEDYVITTRISDHLASEIENCYKNSSSTAELETKLQMLGSKKNRVRLTVERDQEKAKKLRKKLSKEFFVPRALIEACNLY